MKELQTNFTTTEQSKRLLELGVPVDTADCVYTAWKNDTPSITYLFDYKFSSLINDPDIQADIKEGFVSITPCWSVGRLMEIYDTCVENTERWPVVKQGISYVINTIVAIDYAVKDGRIDFSKLED